MRRKSITTAVVLAVLFGPLGLAYVRGSVALLMCLGAIVAVWTVGEMALAPEAVPFAVACVYATAIGVAYAMTREHNEEIEQREWLEEQRHREIVAAAAQR